MDYSLYYESITKPFFAPPGWVFGLAWGIIYPLLAIALIYFFILLKKKGVPPILGVILGVNVAANLLFTPIQLSLGSTLLATLDIFIVLGTLAYFECKIWKHSKAIFFLLLPYLLWGAFATVLQVSIVLLN